MKISEIPPVIFSEVMRDVDLAVSVAHAGSVDPENQPLYHRDTQRAGGTDNAVVPFQERDDKRKFRSH